MRNNKKRVVILVISLIICIVILGATAIEVNYNQSTKLHSNVEDPNNDKLIEELEADYFEDLYSEVPDEEE